MSARMIAGTNIPAEPCPRCAAGDHEGCTEGLCCCLVIHAQDSAVMRGFKRLKAENQRSAR